MNWSWDSNEKVVVVQIEHPRLTALYSPFHEWGRVLALIAVLISMASYAVAALAEIAFALDAISLTLLVVAITRVVTDPGSVTPASGKPKQTEETAHYIDEDC